MTPTRIAANSWRPAESLRLSHRLRLHCFYPLRCTVRLLVCRAPATAAFKEAPAAAGFKEAPAGADRGAVAGAGAAVRAKALQLTVEGGRLFGRPFSCSLQRECLLALSPRSTSRRIASERPGWSSC